MSSAAKRKDDESEGDKVDLFIAKAQHDYSIAIEEAREAGKTTNTPAWKSSYRFNVENHRRIVTQAAAEIQNLCGIAKAAKRLGEERGRFSAWRGMAVSVYETAATRCKEIIARLLREAADEERDNPLLHRGIAAAVHERVAKWPSAEWNDDEGIVVISERK